MTATPEQLATWTAQLAQAEAALHNLMTGATTRVRFADREFEKKPADLAQLRAYIAELKGKLGIVPGGRLRARRIAF